MKKKICPKCKTEYSKNLGFIYCGHCGKKLKVKETIITCNNCKKETPAHFPYCVQCGKKPADSPG